MIDTITFAWITLITLVSVFAITSFDLRASQKITIMVAMLAIGALSYRSVNSRAGLPLVAPSFNNEEVLVLGFYAQKADNRIYIWLKMPNAHVPQVFVFNYNAETHKKLGELREAHKGKPYYKKLSTNKEGVGKRFKDGSNVLIKVESGTNEMPSK